MRQNTLPPFPAVLCMVLCLAFVVGLASMGLTVSRSPSPGVRPTMETMSDPTSLVTAGAREPMVSSSPSLGTVLLPLR
jgi:hypothetical protein